MMFLHLSDIHFLRRYPRVEKGYNSIFNCMTSPLIQIKNSLNKINLSEIDFIINVSYTHLDVSKRQEQAKKLGLKIFIPSLVIALVALGIAQFTPISGTAAIGVASIVAMIVTFIITKAKPVALVEESDRMIQSVGPVGILPQLLAALGAVSVSYTHLVLHLLIF